MSRRNYSESRFEERDSSEVYRRPRRYRDEEDFEVDVSRSRYSGPRRSETIVRERDRDRDTVLSRSRHERGPRLPEFLRDDYGKSSMAGQLVVREETIEEDTISRAPTRRRSLEKTRSSRAPTEVRTEKVERDEVVYRERDRDRGRRHGLPYPQSEHGTEQEEEIIFKERTRSRGPNTRRARESQEEIDIEIKRSDDTRSSRARSEAPPRSEVASRSGRTDVRESANFEEIRFRRGPGEAPRPARTEVKEDEVIIREERRSPSRRPRGREIREEVDIREVERDDIRPVRRMSIGRGHLVARREEEWVIRRPRSPPRPQPREVEREEIVIRRKERSPSPESSPSPSPSPPPPAKREVETEEIIIKRTERSASPPPPPRSRSIEREEIIIRRKERSVSPEAPPPRSVEKEIIIRRKERSPSPDPPRSPTPPPLEPIIRPPIIQEYITHHRHIDHGFERARSPSPPPPPPSPPREENLEIEIHRKGTKNGRSYDENIIIDEKRTESRPREREVSRAASRRRSMSVRERHESPSPIRRRIDDEVAIEADYYNRRAASRGYIGEAYNGATKDWGLVDIPPGTERVRMDGVGGGREEITWGRYNGARRSKFISGDRVYEGEVDKAIVAPAPAPESVREEKVSETKIRITEGSTRSKTRDKMWTEITKDLVIKEAVIEKGYEFEENDEFFYVMEYLQYEDVLKLVELTEDIRRERRERIRELQWEREEAERLPKLLPPAPTPPRAKYDQRIYERDYYYDRERRMYR